MPRLAPMHAPRAAAHEPAHPMRPAVGVTEHAPREDSWPETWRPSANMPEIEPMPGMVHKWVRDPIVADSQEMSWQRSYADGWRPRDPATVPLGPGATYTRGKNIHGVDVIRRGNSVLCHMPERLWEQRMAHTQARARGEMAAQAKSIDGNTQIRQDVETSVTVGRSGRAVPMTD